MSQPGTGGPFERLTLRNVRCFRDATVELDPRVTVLLGENGSGKTTVVEALASLGSGEGEGLAQFPLARGAKSGEAALYEAGRAEPVARWEAGTAAQRLPEERHLLAYGRYRRVVFPGAIERPPGSPTEELIELAGRAGRRKSVTVFEPDNHLLRNLSRYLSALYQGREIDPRLEGVWKKLVRSLSLLEHGISGLKMEQDAKGGYVPKILRKGVAWDFRELSDGYQAILVIVLDLVLRYAYLYSHLNDPLEGPACVAIDEVDLHLHPRWQRVVVGQLVNLFPQTQFVLTTHSPAIAQGAIDYSRKVVTLSESKAGAVPKVLTKKALKKLSGAEIGSVLLEDKLFGVVSRYSSKYAAVEARVKKIQTKMSRGGTSDEEREQLFRDLETLQHLIAADEIRRADGPYLSQMAALRLAFLKDLAAEIKKAKG